MAKETEVQFPTNPADQKVISDAIVEFMRSKTRMESEKATQKDIAETIKEQYDIPPSLFNKIANAAYDPEKKAIADAKAEVFAEGFDLFVANDKRMGGAGITSKDVQAREDEKAQNAEREKLAEQKAKEEQFKSKSIVASEDEDEVTESYDEIFNTTEVEPAEDLEQVIAEVEEDESEYSDYDDEIDTLFEEM